MPQQKQTIERARQVKARYENELLKLANVIGVGVGFQYKNGQPTDTIAIIVNITQKKPLSELDPQDIVPTELEGIPVDVQEVGEIRAL